MLRSTILKRGAIAIAMSAGLAAGVIAPSHAEAVATSAPEGSSAPADSSTLSKADVVRFRNDFGLPSTDAALAGADAGNVPRNQFGVPLTASEVAELNRRQAIADAAGPLFEDVNSRLDTTGGIWIDQKHGGRFVVAALPGLSTADQAAITAKVPPGGTIVFDPTTHSASELRSWSDKLFAELNAQAGRGSLYERLAAMNLKVQGWGVQHDKNELIVTLDHLPKDLTALQDVWDQAVAAGSAPARGMVQFEAATSTKTTDPYETRRDSPGQMKAGLQLNFPSGTCTANLSGTDPGTGRVYQVSAGHCLKPSPIGTRVTTGYSSSIQGNMDIGPVTQMIDANGTDVDALKIELQPGGLGSPYAWAQLGNCGGACQPQIDTITRIAQEGIDIKLYDWVCMGGVSTNLVSCGQITNVDYNFNGEPGVTNVHQYRASYSTTLGDSGALVGNGGTAVGVNIGVSGGTGVFTPLSRVANRLGLVMMVTQPGVVADWALVLNHQSAQCMDVQWNSPNNGAQIWNWPCNWGTAQQWSFVPGYPAGWYNIHRFNPSNKCLDLDIAVNGGYGNGRKIQQWDCNTGDNQVWMLRHLPGVDWSRFNILSMRTDEGGCLDMAWGGGQGALIQQWQCLGGGQVNQLWYLG